MLYSLHRLYSGLNSWKVICASMLVAMVMDTGELWAYLSGDNGKNQ